MALQRLAMIGARGHIGYVLGVLPDMPQVRMVGVCDGAADDPASPVLDWCKKIGQDPAVFTDYRRMLDTVKPDAVVVCGPFEQHASMAIDAMQRGLHVFVEKPVAITADDLQRLRETHRRHPDVHLSAMMGIRYEPGFYTAWQFIVQGRIGDVRLINARKSYKLGQRPPFYQQRQTYGGTIPWVGIHAIDWVLWMSGERVESICALHSADHNQANGSMERSAHCQIGLGGGCIAGVSIDVFRPPSAPTHGDDWIRVVGTSGVIEARNNSLTLINEDNDGRDPVPVASDRQIFKEFVDHVDQRRSGMINAKTTFTLTEVCLLARLSADQGGVVIRPRPDQVFQYAPRPALA